MFWKEIDTWFNFLENVFVYISKDIKWKDYIVAMQQSIK